MSRKERSNEITFYLSHKEVEPLECYGFFPHIPAQVRTVIVGWNRVFLSP